MSSCKKCNERVVWVFDEEVAGSGWLPAQPDSMRYEEEEGYEGGFLRQNWHELHRCQTRRRAERETGYQYPPKPKKQDPRDPLSILWVLDGAPREVVDAAYKTLARLHHPDMGGDLRKMQEINAAYDSVVKRRGAK